LFCAEELGDIFALRGGGAVSDVDMFDRCKLGFRFLLDLKLWNCNTSSSAAGVVVVVEEEEGGGGGNRRMDRGVEEFFVG